MNDYQQFLESDYWKEVTLFVKERDHNMCQICGSLTNLEVHHISYKVNKVSIVGKEKQNLNWLILLCQKHHKIVHNTKNHVLNPKGYFKINATDFKALFGIRTSF